MKPSKCFPNITSKSSGSFSKTALRLMNRVFYDSGLKIMQNDFLNGFSQIFRDEFYHKSRAERGNNRALARADDFAVKENQRQNDRRDDAKYVKSNLYISEFKM